MPDNGLATKHRPPYTKRDAAKWLGVSEKTLDRYIRQGRVPAYRIGPRQIRIRRDDLEALLEPIGVTQDVA